MTKTGKRYFTNRKRRALVGPRSRVRILPWVNYTGENMKTRYLFMKLYDVMFLGAFAAFALIGVNAGNAKPPCREPSYEEK
jgi:hypothetical protein